MVNKIRASRIFVYHILILFFFIQFVCVAMKNVSEKQNSEQMPFVVNIGVIQNLSSPFDKMINLSIEMAKSDFYSENSGYKTRVELRITNDVRDVLDVDLAARKLLGHEQVHAILGHHGPTHETFVAELGRKAQVPIISFTSRSSALSNAENPYFIRTAVSDSVQARALAAICHGFDWKKVVVLYEDTKYGLQFVSHLNKEFQDFKIGLANLIAIPATANKAQLGEELGRLKEIQTTVILVHMNPSLGSQLFAVAKDEGVMGKEHAWIITDSLSNFLNSIDLETRDSMDGVVGIRPYTPPSKSLEKFQKWWKRNSMILNNDVTVPIMDLNVYGLWAYDTLTALAEAVEKIGPVNPSSMYEKTTKNMNLRISSYGPRLQRELINLKIKGLSGDFELADGKLKPPAFEIFNVFGNGERRLGFWTPDRGIIRDLNSSVKPLNYSTSIEELKQVVWPGDSLTRPKGWSIPPTGPLRVGVPWRSGFTEFANAEIDSLTNQVHATGFAVDIFLAALKLLPFPVDYTFICYNGTNGNPNWTYDDLIDEIPAENLDMVVADITMLASRALKVDFSLPYTESVIVLLVNNTKSFDKWIFTKPLRWDLWLAILVSCILMGVVICLLERRATNPEPAERRGLSYLTPIAVLAFHDRDLVSNKWSLFLLVCWLFMANVLMQSFTANLSAILTVDQLINAAPGKYSSIGYQEASYMKNFLVHQLKLDESILRSYSSPKEFDDAMRSGHIEAIVDEIPYMKLLVNRYDSRYKIVGQLNRTEGLGFAFPIGSPLAAYFSRAMLNVTQGPEMIAIEQKNFGPGYSSQDPLSSSLSQGTSRLSFDHFSGLFILTGSITAFAVICSETAMLSRLNNIKRRVFHSNDDGEIGNNVDKANIGYIVVDRDEQQNVGEQEHPQDGDRHEQIVELVVINETNIAIQEVGGEIIRNHSARDL